MDKSIKDNITFNFKNEKIDSKKFNKALVLSNLNDFIESLPAKENTKKIFLQSPDEDVR